MADSNLVSLSEISVPALEDLLYLVDDPSVTPTDAKGTLARILGLIPGAPQCRLTTEAGVPVSTSNRSAQGTIRIATCLPSGVYTGGIGFATTFDGTRRRRQQIGDASLALSTTNTKNYDVFLKDSDLSLVIGTAWTDSFTRADALTEVAGLKVASSDHTYLWLGTIHCSGANATEDSLVHRMVYNAHNQVRRPLARYDTTSSWNVNTGGSVQYANSNVFNVVSVMCGLPLHLELFINTEAQTTAGVSDYLVGFGLNATAYDIVNSSAAYISGAGITPVSAKFNGTLVEGWHFIPWLESNGSGTATIYGSVGSSLQNSGISGNAVM